MGEEGDAGVEQRVPALRPVLLVLQLPVCLLQEHHAVSHPYRSSYHLVYEFLLEAVHPQVVSQSQCLDEEGGIFVVLTVDLQRFGGEILLKKTENVG